MSIFDSLGQVNVPDKEKFQNLFYKLVKKVRDNEFEVEIGEKKFKDYSIIVEENRKNSYFIHIVPEEVYGLFKELQVKAPNEFLRYSVLASTFNNKPVRVSCFGVECNKLGKALISKKELL